MPFTGRPAGCAKGDNKIEADGFTDTLSLRDEDDSVKLRIIDVAIADAP